MTKDMLEKIENLLGLIKQGKQAEAELEEMFTGKPTAKEQTKKLVDEYVKEATKKSPATPPVLFAGGAKVVPIEATNARQDLLDNSDLSVLEAVRRNKNGESIKHLAEQCLMGWDTIRDILQDLQDKNLVVGKPAKEGNTRLLWFATKLANGVEAHG